MSLRRNVPLKLSDAIVHGMSEETNTEAVPSHKVGDKVSISRGKHSGKVAEVIAFASEGGYAVKLDDGTVTTVTELSLKTPGQAVLSLAGFKAIEAASTSAADLASKVSAYFNQTPAF